MEGLEDPGQQRAGSYETLVGCREQEITEPRSAESRKLRQHGIIGSRRIKGSRSAMSKKLRATCRQGAEDYRTQVSREQEIDSLQVSREQEVS